MVEKLHADHLAAQNGTFEPQRRWNWALELPDIAFLPFPGGPILLALEAYAAPTEQSEEHKIDMVNDSRYVAGPVSYEESTLVVKDMVFPDTARLIKAWCQKRYHPVNGRVGMPIEYKFDVPLVLFGPDGSGERIWLLEGMWPRRVAYGELDYKANELNKINIQMRYDKPYYLPAGEIPGTGPSNLGLGNYAARRFL